jgi:hypothetical protein
VEETLSNTPAKEQVERDSNERLAARLKQILSTPGISHKDRTLVDQNLKRLLAAKNA